MKSFLTEFIGTFFLVLTICMTGALAKEFDVVRPIAIGAALMVMVYMGGHVSGAHYNPAVTVAVFLRGKISAAMVLPYMIAQVLGAFGAAAMAHTLTGEAINVAPDPHAESIVPALLVEVLFTFALALVVLNVATAPKTANNSFYGLAIGFTVTVGAFAGGSISGGAFNPAVGTGPALMHHLAEMYKGGEGKPDMSDLSHIWLYWVGPVIGGVLAAIVYKIQNPERESA